MNVLDLFSGIGGELMPSGAKPKVYDAALVQRVNYLYSQGMTQKEIGETTGQGQKIVWNIMRRHGIAARVAAKRNQWGKDNHAWKGDEAGKQAFHRRLYSRYGKPAHCTVCGTTSAKHYDYANLTGHYDDIEDYAAMCRSCHAKYDEQHLKLNSGKGGVL